MIPVIESIMQFISEYRAWIMSTILLFAIPALYYVIAEIFKDAARDLKELKMED